jgi:hypothetical protein
VAVVAVVEMQAVQRVALVALAQFIFTGKGEIQWVSIKFLRLHLLLLQHSAQ